MKLQYCSDLHLEFLQNKKYLTKHPLIPLGDILLLAGDIVPFKVMDEHNDFFDYLADNFKQTFWIPGNHEYYGFDINNKSGEMMEAIRNNVFLINNKVVQLDEVRLIFSTLWSEISINNFLSIKHRMNDFMAINKGNKIFSPEDFNVLHQACKSFIREALSEISTTPTIVVTHHIPTLLNYPAKYKKDGFNEVFAVELYDLIAQSTVDYWLYGHHHFNTPQFFIGKTKLLTNQLGYLKFKENIGFKQAAVIEL